MSTVTSPGQFTVNQLVIYPSPDSDLLRSAVDMRNLVVSIVITESISNESIRGSMEVMDNAGLLEFYPIRGEERIYIDISDAMGTNFSFYGFVYKVDNLQISETNDKVLYRLHFVSYPRFYSDKFRITSAHNDLISNIAEQVFNKYFKESATGPRGSSTNKNITVEPSEGIVKFILPFFTPSQAMKFLESRAYSSRSSSCSFRFFERNDGFYFVTDEYLFRKAYNEDKIFEFTSDENIPQTGDTLMARMMNMSDVKNTDRVDTFDDLHGGAYKNKLLVLDIVNRTTNMKDPAFDYASVKDKWFKDIDNKAYDRHSDTFTTAAFTDDNCRKFIMVKDYVDDNSGQLRGEQFIPEIFSNRLSYMKHLNSIKVTSKSPGRFDIQCGDIIDLKILDFYAVGGNRSLNVQLSGLYLVESIVRSFSTNDVYTNQYTLLKRNWNEPSENAYLSDINQVGPI